MDNPHLPSFFLFIMGGIGVTLIGVCLASTRKALSTQRRYVDAPWHTSSVNWCTAYPISEFQTAEEHTVQFEGRVGAIQTSHQRLPPGADPCACFVE